MIECSFTNEVLVGYNFVVDSQREFYVMFHLAISLNTVISGLSFARFFRPSFAPFLQWIGYRSDLGGFVLRNSKGYFSIVTKALNA